MLIAETISPPCFCSLSSWSGWSSCSRPGYGFRSRSRYIVAPSEPECRPHHCSLSETQSCQNYCQNQGTPSAGGCSCTSGWTGTYCEQGESVRIHIWGHLYGERCTAIFLTSGTLTFALHAESLSIQILAILIRTLIDLFTVFSETSIAGRMKRTLNRVCLFTDNTLPLWLTRASCMKLFIPENFTEGLG